MMLDSEGSLEMMMAWVLYTLHDASVSDEQKKAAIAFAHGALPRGARELILHDKEGADPSKDPNILKRMGEIGDALHRADKGVDALQEVVSEGGSWLAEFMRTLAERAF